jgi:hypothetical protein
MGASIPTAASETVSATLAPRLVPDKQRSEVIPDWQSVCMRHIAEQDLFRQNGSRPSKKWHLNHPDTDPEDSRGNSI